MKLIAGIILSCILLLNNVQSQELALVLTNDKKFGYIKPNGEWLIKPQYIKAKSFFDDMAAVRIDDKWGYINRNGEMAIKPQFKNVKKFSSGVAIVLQDEKWVYIDKLGNRILSHLDLPKLNYFHEDMALFKKDDKVGFINKEGEIVIKPQFNKAFAFKNGVAKVRIEDKWGLIKKDGNFLIKPNYQKIDYCENGSIIAKNNEQIGLIINGEFLPLEGVQKIWKFRNTSHLTYARKDNKMGFINREGKWVIQPQYKRVMAFVSGLAPIQKGKKWGYINESNELVIPVNYNRVEIFSEDGLAAVSNSKKWGFIDTTGKMVIPEEFYKPPVKGYMGIGHYVNKGFVKGVAKMRTKKNDIFIDKAGNILGNHLFRKVELFQ